MDERIEVSSGLFLVVLVVALGAGFHFRAALATDGPPPPPPPSRWRFGVPDFGPPATDRELAILAPLGVGQELDGWLIEGIDAVRDGVVVVHLMHGEESRLNLTVGLVEGATVGPPATAGPYGIYATHLTGPDARGTVATSLSESLGRILTANLAIEVPPGMGPYGVHDPTPDDPPSP